MVFVIVVRRHSLWVWVLVFDSHKEGLREFRPWALFRIEQASLQVAGGDGFDFNPFKCYVCRP